MNQLVFFQQIHFYIKDKRIFYILCSKLQHLHQLNKRVLTHIYFISTILLVCSIGLSTRVLAQQPEEDYSINKQAWFDYNASFKINNKLYYGGDAGYRLDANNQGWNRLYIRPNINGFFNSTFSYKVGIGLFNTFYTQDYYAFELRPFQDLKLKWLDLGFVEIYNRFRLEERYTTGKNIHEFEFRFRYSMGFTTTDYKIFSKTRVFYNHLIFEGFLPFGKGIEYDNYTDMYRAYFALGYRINKKVRIEGHYIWQYAKPYPEAGFQESQSILRLRVYHNFYGGKKKELPTIE